jgi:hypothetical protein
VPQCDRGAEGQELAARDDAACLANRPCFTYALAAPARRRARGSPGGTRDISRCSARGVAESKIGFTGTSESLFHLELNLAMI